MPSLKRTVTRALVVSLCTLGLPIPAVQAELVATDRVEATRQDGRELLGSLFDRADVRAAPCRSCRPWWGAAPLGFRSAQSSTRSRSFRRRTINAVRPLLRWCSAL